MFITDLLYLVQGADGLNLSKGRPYYLMPASCFADASLLRGKTFYIIQKMFLRAWPRKDNGSVSGALQLTLFLLYNYSIPWRAEWQDLRPRLPIPAAAASPRSCRRFLGVWQRPGWPSCRPLWLRHPPLACAIGDGCTWGTRTSVVART